LAASFESARNRYGLIGHDILVAAESIDALLRTDPRVQPDKRHDGPLIRAALNGLPDRQVPREFTRARIRDAAVPDRMAAGGYLADELEDIEAALDDLLQLISRNDNDNARDEVNV
jgi:hypothetical protein